MPSKDNRRKSGDRNIRGDRGQVERRNVSQNVTNAQGGAVQREQTRNSSKKIVVIVIVILVVLGGVGAGVFISMDSGELSTVSTTVAPPTPYRPAVSTTTSAPSVADNAAAIEVDKKWIKTRGDCGRPKQKPNLGRIVGGAEAVKHSWPWQIGLLQYKRYDANTASVKAICGGSIVGPKFVISATHCFLNRKRTYASNDQDGFRVLVGGHDKGRETNGARMLAIAKIHHHPKNNLAVFTRLKKIPVHDLTILILKTVVDPNVASPITGFACLPQPKLIAPFSKICWATGWGKTHGTGHDKQLKQVAQPVVSEKRCKIQYGPGINKESHLCAGPYKGNQGSCQGDSGGPIVCQDQDAVWVLQGATSFGPQPCGSGPAVWVQLSHQMDWVCCVLKDFGPCQNIKCKT